VLLFGAVLVATIIRSIADPLARRLHVPERVAVGIAVLLIVAVIGGLGWAINSQIAAQTEQLADALPRAVALVDDWLAGFGLNHPLAHWVATVRSGNSLLVTNLGGWISSATTAVASLLILLFGGIFLASQPRFYGIGTIKLIPPDRRRLIGEAMEDSQLALRLWLKGQVIAMVLIGILTWIGFLIIGIKSAIILSIIAGFLEFVPFVGPIVSAVPAVLVALVQGPQFAVWTVVMYIVVHHVEAYVIQPVVQQFAVEVPAVIMLFSLLAFGLLFGLVGVFFAAPLAVVCYVLVKRLYVVEALQTHTPIPGENKAERA
jgi:predicted PurR-regulated permease PerM